MRKPFFHQASNEDYWRMATDWTRGTLFPINHTADLETAESVFTLTNAVPEKVGFRERIWTLEEAFKESMDKNCRDNNNKTFAYVLTGAVPSDANIWKKRVNIPSFFWKAFCCYNNTNSSWISMTYRDENKNKSNNKIQDLRNLHSFLQNRFKRNITLFQNNCTVGQF